MQYTKLLIPIQAVAVWVSKRFMDGHFPLGKYSLVDIRTLAWEEIILRGLENFYLEIQNGSVLECY
jgi:hypothetical protein